MATSHACTRELFKQIMGWFGLDLSYGAYVDVAGAATLAVNNLMSYFGLHRRRELLDRRRDERSALRS